MGLTEFIRKIVHIILRSRFQKSSESLSSIFSAPLVLDIIVQSRLAERWVLQEETCSDHQIQDSTELVLLCQSIFSFINQMPLLRDADSYSISSLEGQVLASDSDTLNVGFDDSAILKNHKFKSANTENGTLYLSIVYDASLESLENLGRPVVEISPEKKAIKSSSPFPSPSLVRKMTQFSNDKTFEKSLSQIPIPSSISNSSTISALEKPVSGLNINQKPNFELFGSFVGSYEQSLLSGRMSTFPSKPLWFSLEIGVIGSGQCKSKLKCPPHRTIAFPAHYYEYENDAHQITPYVGNVEISQNNQGYRIPSKGQLQVIVKNQKVPFKIFLIPYDLSDMPRDTKTYLRQKSYLTKGHTPASNTIFSFSRTTSTSDLQFNGNDILQHAIHLQIICTNHGKLYVHNSVRVVFSRRIPDQKLRVVNEVPSDPKFFIIDSPKQGSTCKVKTKKSRKLRSEYKDTPLKQIYSASPIIDEFAPCNTSEGR